MNSGKSVPEDSGQAVTIGEESTSPAPTSSQYRSPKKEHRKCLPCGREMAEETIVDETINELIVRTMYPQGEEAQPSGPIKLDVQGSRQLIKAVIDSDPLTNLPDDEDGMEEFAQSAQLLPRVEPPTPKRAVYNKDIHSRVKESALGMSDLAAEFRNINTKVEARLREQSRDLEIDIESTNITEHKGLQSEEFLTPLPSPDSVDEDSMQPMEVVEVDVHRTLDGEDAVAIRGTINVDTALPEGISCDASMPPIEEAADIRIRFPERPEDNIIIDQTSRGGIVTPADLLEDLITKIGILEKANETLRADVTELRKDKVSLEGRLTSALNRIQALEDEREKKQQTEEKVIQLINDLNATIIPIENWWRESTSFTPLMKRRISEASPTDAAPTVIQGLPPKVSYSNVDKEKWLASSEKLLKRIKPKFLNHDIMVEMINGGGPAYFFSYKFPKALITKEMIKNTRIPQFVQSAWESIDTALYTAYGPPSKRQYIPSGGLSSSSTSDMPPPKSPVSVASSPRLTQEIKSTRTPTTLDYQRTQPVSKNVVNLPWKRSKTVESSKFL